LTDTNFYKQLEKGEMTETFQENMRASTALNPIPTSGAGVCFDPDAIRLEGYYSDELAAHRARKSWRESLERYFLLDEQDDFTLHIRELDGASEMRFVLWCDFHSACARYAFWRLTNHQAPEAQYVIETGHIPRAESQSEQFLFAPDLRSTDEGPLVFRPDTQEISFKDGWFDRVKKLINKIAQTPEG
jgi:hypothetical protein